MISIKLIIFSTDNLLSTKLTLLFTEYQGYCSLLHICRSGSSGCVDIGAGGTRADDRAHPCDTNIVIYVSASDIGLQVPN